LGGGVWGPRINEEKEGGSPPKNTHGDKMHVNGEPGWGAKKSTGPLKEERVTLVEGQRRRNMHPPRGTEDPIGNAQP